MNNDDQNEHNKAVNKLVMLVCLALGALAVKCCEHVAGWL